MSDITVPHSSHQPRSGTGAAPPSGVRQLGWVGGAVFLLAYLANGPLTGLVSTQPLPLPGAPSAEVLDYLLTQGTAQVVSGLTHVVSMIGLVIFCLAVNRLTGPDSRRSIAAVIAVASMLVSAGLSITSGLMAPALDPSALLTMRSVSFYAGGVLHVVALGALAATVVLGPVRSRFGRPTRILGYVAGACALLSVLSLVIYYASVFLPVGRILIMVWTVVAGLSLLRQDRTR